MRNPMLETYMRSTIGSCIKAFGVSALLTLSAAPASYAARLQLGPRTCSQQFYNCVSYRRTRGPFGSEGQCTVVWRMC
jgi:hypothetical protein